MQARLLICELNVNILLSCGSIFKWLVSYHSEFLHNSGKVLHNKLGLIEFH